MYYTKPAKTASANIVSDIKSLQKLYSLLTLWDIWYATCIDITSYIIAKKHYQPPVSTNKIHLTINYPKKTKETVTPHISEPIIVNQNNVTIYSYQKNNKHLINLPIQNGETLFLYKKRKLPEKEFK